MTIALALLGLGLLIFVHELGHFGVSLALGMRPRKFYVGFPPALVKTTRRGIEYGIGAIPLGGFVKIPGMHRPAGSDADVAFGRALEEAPSLTGPVTRLRNALAAGDHDTARDALRVLGELVEESSTLSPPALKAARRGLADMDDALGDDAYWRAATWKRVATIAAGPAANIVLAIVLFAVLFMIAGGAATTTVGEVVAKTPAGADTPAAAIGLRPGDRIVELNSREAVDARAIARAISTSEGRPLTVVVLRNGERVTLGPTAPYVHDGTYRLGFSFRGEDVSLLGAVGESFRVTGLVTKDIGGSLGRLVTGEGREDIASPVGIVQGSSEAAKRGTDTFIWVLGLISLSIALLNLLPLLPLDGGHIVFAVLEGVRGRAVRREVYERVSVVGIGLVLLLFVIGLSNDVGRLS